MNPEHPIATPELRVSYAQNGEDIVLARGLRHDDGFYVDIGAFDPKSDSVTKLFYDRGWSGINVDPVPEVIALFERERPRDINVQIAISVDSGEAELWTGPAELVGHSTLDAAIARSHIADGIEFTRSTVPTMRLDELLDARVPEGTVIDFLKIDVEGHEQAVLESCDWSRWRPRVVVVECIAPYTGGSTHGEWEHILLANDYTMTLFDGLNRFYVAGGETELAEALHAPASVVDLFEKAPIRELNNAFHDLTINLSDLDHAGRLSAAAQAAEVAALHARLVEMSGLLAENIERQRTLTIEIDRRDSLLEGLQSHNVALEKELDEVRANEAALRKELTAIEQTKVMRYSRIPRRLYRWLRIR
jgi:FkbM family methyltransferase